MKRLSTAVKAFIVLLFTKDVSLNLRYDNKELTFEEGLFKRNSIFLNSLSGRPSVPDFVLSQYKEILNDYDFKEN